MKKKIALLLTCVLAIGTVVSGCGSSANNNDSSAKADGSKSSGEKKKIVFWDMVWGNEDMITIAKDVCAKYTEESGVEVEYQSVPWDNFYQTFQTAIAAGEAPDCSSGSSYMPFQFYDLDAILPLDDLIEDMRTDGEIDDYASKDFVESYKYDGHYVALPTGIDMRILYCRQDILEANGLEIPTNWDEFKQCLEKLSDPDKNKYGMTLACNGNNGKVMFEWLINNGGGLFNEKGEPDCVTDENIETVNYLLDLINNKLINPASAGLTSDDAKSSFAKGEIAFYYGSPGISNTLPDLKDKIAIVSPLESFGGNQGAVYWNGGLMAYNQTEYPEETKEFMRYFVNNMTEYCVDGQYSMMPTRNTVLADSYYADDKLTQQIINEYFPVMKTIAANSDSLFSQLSAVESDGSIDAVIQSMFTPGITAEEILKTEQKNLESIMNQN